MNIAERVAEIEKAGLPAMTNYRNERALTRATIAREKAIAKIKKELSEQIRLNPEERAIQKHIHLLEIAYTVTDANLWQSGEEFIFFRG